MIKPFWLKLASFASTFAKEIDIYNAKKLVLALLNCDSSIAAEAANAPEKTKP